MINLPSVSIDLDGTKFKGEFKTPFIPPSKQQEADKYEPFKGIIDVEPDRLLLLYEILDEGLKGKFIDDIFVLSEDTQSKKVVILIPPNHLSENAKSKGAVYAIKFHNGKNGKIKTGRIFLSMALVNLLKKMIRDKGKMQWAFLQIDNKGKPHIIIIERNKGKVKVIYPVEVELSESKKAKLQLTVNSYLDEEEKVPTTIVADKVVFTKNSKGDFAIHTPHHSINIGKDEVKKLKLLVDD